MKAPLNRKLRRPSVESAEKLHGRLLHQQKSARRILIFIYTLTVAIILYFTANISFNYLVLAIGAALFNGATIFQLRSFGEQYRFFKKTKDSVESLLANNELKDFKFRSRILFAKLIIGVLIILGLVIWTMLNEGRLWLILPGILIVIYISSSIKPEYIKPKLFTNKATNNKTNNCRIVLFRSFTDASSSIAKSALAPILSSYGSVEIVRDDTFASSESEGIFGMQYANHEKPYKVHQFTDSNWHKSVAEIIRECDIAVFDITSMRPGVFWEFVQCHLHLPPWRIISVINVEAFDYKSLKDFMKVFYLTAKISRIPEDVRYNMFAFVPNAWYQETLATTIHHKMRAINAIDESALPAEYWYDTSEV